LIENYIKNKIVFVHNGIILDYNSKEKLKVKFKNGDNIIVYNNENISPENEDIIFTFKASSGSKKIIKASKNITIEILLKTYLEEIKIKKNANKEELIFLFNDLRIDPHSKEIIAQRFKTKESSISVLDMNNIIKNSLFD